MPLNPKLVGKLNRVPGAYTGPDPITLLQDGLAVGSAIIQAYPIFLGVAVGIAGMITCICPAVKVANGITVCRFTPDTPVRSGIVFSFYL